MAEDLRAACARVVHECACEGVRRTARAVTRHYERALAPSGLRATQFPILVALAAAGPLPLTLLAEVLGLDRTTLTRNLGGLEARRLVEIASAEDRRTRVVSLTAEGAEVLRQALPIWQGAQATVEERFGRSRLGELLGGLSELTDLVRS